MARGATVWLTGCPSAGKTTLATAMAERLERAGRRVEVLDGDAVRSVMTAHLGFSRADRATQVTIVGHMANLLARNAVVAVCALVSPYRADRDAIRRLHGAGPTPARFVEVLVDAPRAVCERRDTHGLYRRHRAGQLRELTGVDAPYEPPLDPEVVLNTAALSVGECLEELWAAAIR